MLGSPSLSPSLKKSFSHLMKITQHQQKYFMLALLKILLWHDLNVHWKLAKTGCHTNVHSLLLTFQHCNFPQKKLQKMSFSTESLQPISKDFAVHVWVATHTLRSTALSGLSTGKIFQDQKFQEFQDIFQDK